MSELHAVQETRGSKCVSTWEKQSGGLFRSECISHRGRQVAAPTIGGSKPCPGKNKQNINLLQFMIKRIENER